VYSIGAEEEVVMASFGLLPRTDAGRKAVALAEHHAIEIRERAAEHDRGGTFPVEAFDAMKASGLVAAAVPAELGGMGVSSVRDLMIATNRLARADGSVAIALNMHFSVSFVVGRLLRAAREAGDTQSAAPIEAFLRLLGSGMIAMANATEPGTDVMHPMAEATRVEGGWRLDGRKSFGTLSPVADVMLVMCRRQRDDGSYASGNAIVFRGTPGQTVLDNWDALGMRASGSHDILYENCVIAEGQFFEQSDWGDLDESRLIIGTGSNLGLLGAFVGIAEAARDEIAAMLNQRTKQPTGRPLAERHGIRHAMGELEIELNTCHAHLAWMGAHIDHLLVDRPVASVSLSELHDLMAAFQASKLTAQRSAINVVDKALQLSGGAGYMSANPLARLYRDVRAGPFMQPLSANDAHEYIGCVALGQDPVVEK
jgi:alkylation response protein AidB-like acyl-CoA dehydrogenase